MEADTLAAIVRNARDREKAVRDAPGRTTAHSYEEFATNAWKAGNLLRHYGVRRGSTVTLVVGPKAPEPDDRPGWLGDAVDPLLGLFGTGALGATVDLSPDSPVEGRALLAPDAWLERYETAPGCSVLAYGGPPTDPAVAHFERERWSENPTEPPGQVEPDDVVLRVDGREYTHRTLLETGREIARKHDLREGATVGLAAPLSSAGAIAAGVVAPVSAGATIRPLDDTDPGVDLAYVVRAETAEGRDEGGDTTEIVDPDEITLE